MNERPERNKAYEKMKGRLGSRLAYLRTGAEIRL